MAIAFPQLLLCFQVFHLLGCDSGKHAAILEVALDVVLGYPLANDPAAFERHLAQQLRMLGADAALYGVDVAAVTVDDLTAVTTRGAETDFGSLDNAHLEAAFQQGYGRGQAGVACTDNAGVCFYFAMQFRAWRSRVS